MQICSSVFLIPFLDTSNLSGNMATSELRWINLNILNNPPDMESTVFTYTYQKSLINGLEQIISSYDTSCCVINR